VNDLRDINCLPIVFTKHAALALLERFELDLTDVKHCIKTARIDKPIEKEGSIGVLQSNIGDCKIKFICTIKRNTLVIITVEECK
jgi:hypothetical protein